MFEIPGSDIVSVHITGDTVKGEAAPIFIHGAVPAEEEQEEEQVLAQVKWGEERVVGQTVMPRWQVCVG